MRQVWREGECHLLTFCQEEALVIDPTQLVWIPINSILDEYLIKAFYFSSMAGIEHTFYGTWEVYITEYILHSSIVATIFRLLFELVCVYCVIYR